MLFKNDHLEGLEASLHKKYASLLFRHRRRLLIGLKIASLLEWLKVTLIDITTQGSFLIGSPKVFVYCVVVGRNPNLNSSD